MQQQPLQHEMKILKGNGMIELQKLNDDEQEDNERPDGKDMIMDVEHTNGNQEGVHNVIPTTPPSSCTVGLRIRSLKTMIHPPRPHMRVVYRL